MLESRVHDFDLSCVCRAWSFLCRRMTTHVCQPVPFSVRDAGQWKRAPGTLICNDVCGPRINSLVLPELVKSECLFAHEPFSTLASVPATFDVFDKTLALRYGV